MSITIVGLGAGDISQLSLGAYKELKSGKKIYLRTKKHPMVEECIEDYISFDSYYDEGENFENVYEKIARAVIELGKYEDIVYAVPGHPRVAETTVFKIEDLSKKYGIDLKIIPSMSFVDAIYSYLGFDPSEGFRLLDAFELKRKDLDNESNIIITQVYDRFIASNVKLELMEYYDDEKEIWILGSAGVRGEESKKRVKLFELDLSINEFDHLTSLYIPKGGMKKFRDVEDILSEIDSMDIDEERNLCSFEIEIDDLIDEIAENLYNILVQSSFGKKCGYFDFYEVCDTLYFKKFTKNIEK